MKVSVSIITYNHEKYIAQAIESALMQKTDFDYEILIGEDDSSDTTRAIVKEYKRKYPDRIKLFLHDRKRNKYADGSINAKFNSINNLKHAKGEYIAILEGDDYWIDVKKLQLQVDALDSNPDFVICFHNAYIYNEEDGTKKVSNLSQQRETTIFDIIDRWYITTASMMFRNHLITKFPDWWYKVKSSDWALHLLLSRFGKIYYLDRIMSVYRLHPGGISRIVPLTLEDDIMLMKNFNWHSNGLYSSAIKVRLHFYYLRLTSQMRRKNILMALVYVAVAIRYKPPKERDDWEKLLKSLIPGRLHKFLDQLLQRA